MNVRFTAAANRATQYEVMVAAVKRGKLSRTAYYFDCSYRVANYNFQAGRIAAVIGKAVSNEKERVLKYKSYRICKNVW